MIKSFALALLASIAVAQDDDNDDRTEPDKSKFPDDWTKSCDGSSECSAKPVSPSVREIAQWDDVLMYWWMWCIENPEECRM